MVVSLITPEKGRKVTAEFVISFLKERLASFKVPRKVKPAEARKLALRKLSEASEPQHAD